MHVDNNYHMCTHVPMHTNISHSLSANACISSAFDGVQPDKKPWLGSHGRDEGEEQQKVHCKCVLCNERVSHLGTVISRG